MTRKTVTSLALAAGCAIALAVPAAQAQTQVITNGPEWTPGDASASAMRNNAESREYMRLLQTNWNFRQARLQRECGPITDMQLRHSCIASFDEYTPFVDSTRLAGNALYPPNPVSPGVPPSTDMMTGSGTGTMTSTTTTGTTFHSPDMYGTGYGSSVPSANYTTPSNAFGASRNLPAEQSGMIQAPGAMPNYPGPRPSGPLSGGGR
ncbi:MAG: hypothetical protein AB7H90_00435 [Alphaproteobacteria bacterium]